MCWVSSTSPVVPTLSRLTTTVITKAVYLSIVLHMPHRFPSVHYPQSLKAVCCTCIAVYSILSLGRTHTHTLTHRLQSSYSSLTTLNNYHTVQSTQPVYCWAKSCRTVQSKVTITQAISYRSGPCYWMKLVKTVVSAIYIKSVCDLLFSLSNA